jgi:hypothetical protein
VGAQPERHTQNLHHSEPSNRRRHDRDPKGLGAEAPRSSTCDMPLKQPFHTLADIFRNATEELRNIAA